MKRLSTNEIRKIWLDFFKSKNHHILPSASLIPVNDLSLLWINSGVATLKPYFDGRLIPPSPRLTNSQRALRTNDIENVGVTSRHQTMFEMLGNFSIGDYFKKEAIEFAWELLTSDNWFGIDKEKLYITVFEEDLETFEIWTKNIKISTDHIFKMNRNSNFWDVGIGPCGPCTEVFYDRGDKWDLTKKGTKLIFEDIENDRYIEIWNIVFSQFNNDGNGNYIELPRKNIDTGAGLERLASIFQDTDTNFETDIFLPIIKKIENYTNYQYNLLSEKNSDSNNLRIAFRVISDHIRAVVFAIADGIFPGNKDRGYIIRRLIRRSATYGLELGIKEVFLYELVDEVISVMAEFYPYLNEKRELIKTTIKVEEIKFSGTLSKGYDLLNRIMVEEKKISGKNAWLLFESFGFPIELILEISKKQNVDVDFKEFESLSNKSKELARNSRQNLKAWNTQDEFYTKLDIVSEFIGYENNNYENAKVVSLFDDGKNLEELNNQSGFVILDKTPFYAEKGGQVGDTGIIKGNDGIALVIDTQQGPNNQHIHQVKVTGTIKKNDLVTATIDETKRTYIMKNHSGTHMIHWALREVLGTAVMQSGSYNDEKGLRMDFTFNRQPTTEELDKAQNLVLDKIKKSYNREIYYCSMKEAINKYKALAFFTEKYNDIVRVVKFGSFSSELCGGTHVENTKMIEDFMIIGTESKGNGLYRIKCLTSFLTINNYVKEQFEQIMKQVDDLMLKYSENNSLLRDKTFEKLFIKIKNISINKNNLNLLKISFQNLKQSYYVFNTKVQELLIKNKLKKYDNIKPVINSAGINEINLSTENLTIKELKQLADDFRNKFSNTIIILRSSINNTNLLIVSVSETLQDNFSALDLFKNQPGFLTKGGGNRSFAQGKYQKL